MTAALLAVTHEPSYLISAAVLAVAAIAGVLLDSRPRPRR